MIKINKNNFIIEIFMFENQYVKTFFYLLMLFVIVLDILLIYLIAFGDFLSIDFIYIKFLRRLAYLTKFL